MPAPNTPQRILLFIVALIFLLAFIQVGAITVAFDKLGLSRESAFLLLFVSLFGSVINLPLFSIRSQAPPQRELPPYLRELLRHLSASATNRTIIAVNVGGGLIPISFSAYLVAHHPLSTTDIVLATALVAAVCHISSRPIPGIGIGMPIFIAPITAAIAAVVIDPKHSAPLAYICGTMGVLIGADILHLKEIRQLGTPIAAIGGAGTFDGIFLTGIIAVLLA